MVSKCHHSLFISFFCSGSNLARVHTAASPPPEFFFSFKLLESKNAPIKQLDGNPAMVSDLFFESLEASCNPNHVSSRPKATAAVLKYHLRHNIE